MENLYIVKYSSGEIDERYNVEIFATMHKYVAIDYTIKFNEILKRWKHYYKQYENPDGWIKDEYVEKYFDRWYCLKDVKECYVKILELR